MPDYETAIRNKYGALATTILQQQQQQQQQQQLYNSQPSLVTDALLTVNNNRQQQQQQYLRLQLAPNGAFFASPHQMNPDGQVHLYST